MPGVLLDEFEVSIAFSSSAAHGFDRPLKERVKLVLWLLRTYSKGTV